MKFVAIDFETANSDRSSICQIGMAEVQDGKVVDTTTLLVDPQTHFDAMNTYVHGIEASDVQGQPLLTDVLPRIVGSLSGQIVVSHSAFDRGALLRASNNAGIEAPDCFWLDSMRVVRRAWPDEFGKSGYGLSNVAKVLGIEFEHHDAGEDARVAAEVLIRAIEHTGIALADWPSQQQKSLWPQSKADLPEPDQNGPFWGSVVVFTGALTLPRSEAQSAAAALGFVVGSGVTKKTTTLVVGDQDASKLGGEDKSSKHRKAEDLILKGVKIDVLTEGDFLMMFD